MGSPKFESLFFFILKEENEKKRVSALIIAVANK